MTSGVTATALSVRLTALAGVPLVTHNDDLAQIILSALRVSGEALSDGDIVVLAQKIVSKAEGRLVRLSDITPSSRAEALAMEVNKDPRLVELILQESTEVVRSRRDVLVVAHRLGFVIANAGIDQSNIMHSNDGDDMALLLPVDPDETCAKLCSELKRRVGVSIGCIINDSHGRAFRNGTVGVALGASGVSALSDLRGRPDLFSRALRHSEAGTADEIASAASLLMGQAGEGRPIVLVRGLAAVGEGRAADLIRSKEIDLFRTPAPPSIQSLNVDLLDTRRSIRRYSDRPVATPILEKLLWAATCAPSAHNRQPWRFAVLMGGAAKQRLARAMGENLRADRSRDGDAPNLIEGDVFRSIQRIVAAPAVIMVCMTMDDMDRYADARRASAERQMAIQGTAMAAQNLQLAAHACGLGSSIMCAPLFCPDTVRECLRLPPSWEPQMLITIGWPGSQGKPFNRHELRHVMRVIDDD